MIKRGFFSQKTNFLKIVILCFLILISALITNLFAFSIDTFFFKFDKSVFHNGQYFSVESLKLLQFFNSIGIFIIPILLYSYLTDFNLKFKFNFKRQELLLVCGIIILGYPFISYIYELNQKINLPEWALSYEQRAEQLTREFIKMDSLLDLGINLILIAIIPAVGEELLFRGYLQESFSKWLQNAHLAIIFSAFLFSAIHLQFHGFFPRFILGILLGYLFFWSGSIMIPIFAHFVNNALVVIFSYTSFINYSSVTDYKTTFVHALFSFMSIVLLLFLLYNVMKNRKNYKVNLD